MCYPRFQDRISSLRKKWNIPEFGFVDDKELEKWVRNMDKVSDNAIKAGSKKIPINMFNDDLHEMIKDFNLSSNYVSSIENYLLSNKLINPDSITVLMKYNNKLKRRELFIQIFAETRWEDVDRVWTRVKRYQKYLPRFNPGRFKKKGNLKFEKEAYLLHKKGANNNEIAKKISTVHKTFGYEDVGNFISSFKKRFKKFTV